MPSWMIFSSMGILASIVSPSFSSSSASSFSSKLTLLPVGWTESHTTPSLLTASPHTMRSGVRSLQSDNSNSRIFDLFLEDIDLCLLDPNVEEGDIADVNKNAYNSTVFGRCDTSLFPTCSADSELICYNRRPSRSFFYLDTRQPVYYIDYRNVFCYPSSWSGCSSCSPGRYCLTEQRCILEEKDADGNEYPCEKWF